MGKEQYKQIVAEVLDAVECARAGKPHPRLFSSQDRAIEMIDRQAAAALIPRVPVTAQLKPSQSEAVQDWSSPHTGAGGANLSD